MRLLRTFGRTGLLIITVVALAVGTTVQSGAHPPRETDHGVNESTFWTLWAGDTDSSNLSAPNATQPFRTLTNGTDVPLDRPPRAVETWNTGEHGEVPVTGTDAATHPRNTTLSDGTYLRDVGVSMVAVQPSTRVHLSERTEPLYIAPDGEVHGALDYRIAVPPTSTSDSREIRWEVRTHEVESIRLRLDGAILNETNGTKTPTLSYEELAGSGDLSRELTLEATVSTTLERTVITEDEDCEDTANESASESCTSATSTLHQDSLTVQDNRRVRVYVLSVSGFEATYPDGDLGLVTYKNLPWYGLSLPDGAVRGVWRFYSARDHSWDNLTTYRSGGTQTAHSPVHPLQVHAYPIESGPTPWPRATISILEIYGEQYTAPTLPQSVQLDTVSGPYTGSFGIATRIERGNSSPSPITAIGLVRGTSIEFNPEQFSPVPISESNLTLERTNQTDETVTIRAYLRAADTGEPIETADREGSLRINGQRFETNESGLVSVTVSRDQDAVSARYIPGPWWRNVPGYTGDTAVVHTGGTVLQYVDALFHGFVPIGALLLGGYLISRFTSWGFWPPWRGL